MYATTSAACWRLSDPGLSCGIEMWIRSNRSATDLGCGRRVVRPQHRAALTVRRREEARIAGDQERLCRPSPDAPARLARALDRQPLQRRMITDIVGRFAMGNLPDNVTFI